MSSSAAQEEYLVTKQVSALTRISVRWLVEKRKDGSGPRYVRTSERSIVYRRSDVEAWMANRTFAHRAAEATGRVAT